MDKITIMFVCTGNVCRSPLAQGVFEHHARVQGVGDRFAVESAGVQSFHVGEQVDSRTRQVAREYGVHLDHLARQIQPRDLRDYDLILAMDRVQLQELRRMTGGDPELSGKIRLFGEFDPESESPTEISDPCGAEDEREAFRAMFEIIDRTARNLMEQYARPHSHAGRG